MSNGFEQFRNASSQFEQARQSANFSQVQELVSTVQQQKKKIAEQAELIEGLQNELQKRGKEAEAFAQSDEGGTSIPFPTTTAAEVMAAAHAAMQSMKG